MADKQRRTFPVAVRFFDGELPTAAKFNAIANQSRQGLNILEYSVGDIWNQGGDAFLFDKEEAQLQITNIGRLLGKSANLNPYIPSLPNIGEYTYLFTNDAGNFEATLTFPPHGTTPNYVWTNSTNSSTPKATKEEVLAANDWWIDTSTGQIYSYTIIASNWTLTYCPIVSGSSYDEGTFNVIPDPDTDASYAFQSLKVESISGDNYYIYLPPRGPLATRTLTRSPIDDTSNYSSTPSSELRFWQADSVEAETGTNGNHYRYNLPDILSSATTGTAIPDGFLYLWDPINKTIIEGVSFSIAETGNRWKLTATGSTLTTALDDIPAYTGLLSSNSHDNTYYPANGLSLIIVGTNITKTVTNLVKSFLNHSHSDSNSLPGIPVPHSKLTGLFEPVVSGVTYVNSQLDNDDHPQYFHRGGAQVARDRYNNAILGDVILGSIDSTNNYQNTLNNSRAIYFGANGSSAAGYLSFDFADPITSRNSLTLKTRTTDKDIVIHASGVTSDVNIRAKRNISITSETGIATITPTPKLSTTRTQWIRHALMGGMPQYTRNTTNPLGWGSSFVSSVHCWASYGLGGAGGEGVDWIKFYLDSFPHNGIPLNFKFTYNVNGNDYMAFAIDKYGTGSGPIISSRNISSTVGAWSELASSPYENLETLDRENNLLLITFHTLDTYNGLRGVLPYIDIEWSYDSISPWPTY